MDGPRSRGYGARSGYDVRTRCVRGCTERRQGVSPGRIRHETETASSLRDSLSRRAVTKLVSRNRDACHLLHLLTAAHDTYFISVRKRIVRSWRKLTCERWGGIRVLTHCGSREGKNAAMHNMAFSMVC